MRKVSFGVVAVLVVIIVIIVGRFLLPFLLLLSQRLW